MPPSAPHPSAKAVRRVAALIAALACGLPIPAGAEPGDAPAATPPPVAVAPPAAPRPPVMVAPAATKLQGAFVYVYSFLDVRDQQFGPRMLDQLDQQLTADLSAEGVSSKVLRFKDSTVGETFAQSGQQPGAWGYSGSDLIPVNQTIASNAADERATGARFRLIVFPANFSTQGAWQFYDVRWILIDAATGVRVWQNVYKTSHLTWWRNDEDSVNRAKGMLAKVMADLKGTGLL